MIYITGNTHGEFSRFETDQARKLTCDDFLIICGDFGFVWNCDKTQETLLNKLGQKPYTILFVDGTHENFDQLNAYPVKLWNGGQVHQIRPNILHLMRGEIFKIEGHSFFTFGGGDTEEKEVYIEADKWWPAEMPTRKEMIAGVKNLYRHHLAVDYIITHEPCPNNVIMGTRQGLHRTSLQSFFEELLKQVSYKQWFFGAQHIDRTMNSRHISVFKNILPLNDPNHPASKESSRKK